MPLDSRLIAQLDQGLILDITLEDLPFRVYVAQRPADVEQVADLVPAEQFQGDGDVHVAAIHDGDDASEQIQDVLFNLNPGDAIVFLCTGSQAYADALAELGQAPDSDAATDGGQQ
ncbi:hypothetical protein [Castellaniella sp.]|uniref:hypothetical protein n=1 Tax=Castellaniella sp. TaxID=1955812 RepID=UPI002AFEC7B4|nr:hypothetical protein [Castellaniella sp.]